MRKTFFDAVVSIDSYHYFGNNDAYFEKVLKPTLKKGAIVALAFPGMKKEFHKNIPEDMKPLWDEETLQMWHSIDLKTSALAKWIVFLARGMTGSPVITHTLPRIN